MTKLIQTAPSNLPRRYGVVAVVQHEERFLVIRRSAMVSAPRKFCFPGGGIEAGETEAQTLVREIQEELGVAIEPVRRVWQSVTAWNVDLAWWLGNFSAMPDFVPNPAEVESVHWLTAAEMLALPELLDSNREFFEALAAGKFTLTQK